MNQSNKHEIDTAFAQLPSVVRSALHEVKYEEALRVIAKEFAMHIDEGEIMEYEIMKTLVGLAHPNTLIASLADKLHISGDKATMMVEAVNETIFLPIRKMIEAELDKNISQGDMASLHNDANLDMNVADSQVGSVIEESDKDVAGANQIQESAVADEQKEKIDRTISTSYVAGAVSHERKDVVGDPYREQI